MFNYNSVFRCNNGKYTIIRRNGDKNVQVV